MKFITIVENVPFYQWQIELLIQSFKKYNLQDDLYVFLIGENNKMFSKNIDQLKNLYYMKENSKRFGFNYFDFYESILYFKQNNPDEDFCIIDPDCILNKNDFSFFKDKNIFYQAEIIKKDYIEKALLALIFERIQQICSVFYFSKDTSIDFFIKSLYATEEFIIEILKTNEINVVATDYNIFKYGLLLIAILERKNILTSFDLVNFPQTNSSDSIFLSYKHNIMPFFKKNDFKFDRNNIIMTHPESPFQTLMELPDFPNCIPLKKIAISYEKKLDEI